MKLWAVIRKDDEYGNSCTTETQQEGNRQLMVDGKHRRSLQSLKTPVSFTKDEGGSQDKPQANPQMSPCSCRITQSSKGPQGFKAD